MKKAFTLAEVLITLGIIGVVAALTLPSLIQNQQKRSLEVATKKFYTNMSQAIKHYMADEGVDDLRNSPLTSSSDSRWEDNNANNAVYDFIKKYFKVVKECSGEERCFADRYPNYPDEDGPDNIYEYLYSGTLASVHDFVTADGMSLEIIAGDDDYPISVLVDVNGKKGPNVVGYDLWTMDIFYDGTIDESNITPECKKGINNLSGWKTLCGDKGTNQAEARATQFEECRWDYGGCFGHFMENGFKFDY